MAHRKISPIPYEKLVKVFKGDHLILTKPGVNRPVVIRRATKDVPVTHIMTNLRTSGISRERYFQLLDKV